MDDEDYFSVTEEIVKNNDSLARFDKVFDEISKRYININIKLRELDNFLNVEKIIVSSIDNVTKLDFPDTTVKDIKSLKSTVVDTNDSERYTHEVLSAMKESIIENLRLKIININLTSIPCSNCKVRNIDSYLLSCKHAFCSDCVFTRTSCPKCSLQYTTSLITDLVFPSYDNK